MPSEKSSSDINRIDDHLNDIVKNATKQLKGHWFADLLDTFADATLSFRQITTELADPCPVGLPGAKAYMDLRDRLCDLIAGRKRLGKDDVDIAIDTARLDQGQDSRSQSRIKIFSEKDLKKVDVRRPG